MRTTTATPALTVALTVAALCAADASAQSLFQRPVQPALDASGRPDPAAALQGVSMMAVIPPPPREFEKHDLISIIIDETTTAESRQSLETDKSYEASAGVTQLPSLRHLLELQLEPGNSSRNPLLDIEAEHQFDGEGEYSRDDRFVARIMAEVIDVKPNGNVVIEARKTIAKDNEIQTIVLAGVCRQEDVTDANTVLSSQIAMLTVSVQNAGEVRKASKKGIIPRALETVFAF